MRRTQVVDGQAEPSSFLWQPIGLSLPQWQFSIEKFLPVAFGVTAAVALGTATVEFYRIEPELVQLSHIALVVDVLLSSFAALCKGVRVSKDRICQSCQCKDWSEW